MVSLDFFRHFPTVRNRANEPAPAAQLRVALDKDDMRRSTVLEPPLGQERSSRAYPHRLRDLLLQLLESIAGKPLSRFLPRPSCRPTPRSTLIWKQ